MKAFNKIFMLSAVSAALFAQAGFNVSRLGPRVVAYEGREELAAIAAESKVLIFFGATWCPTCQAFYRDAQRNTASIPEDVTIVFADYDTERELKTQFGVARQHTFVQLNNDGTRKKFWVGSNTITAALGRME